MSTTLQLNKILNTSQQLMLTVGYRKVTMDEIASSLRMSKNTIYKHFQSKEEIAIALVKRLQLQLNDKLLQISTEDNDALTTFTNSVYLMRRELGPWFNHFFKDIQSELPQLWEEFLRFRNEKFIEVRSIVAKGIKRGKFRKINEAIAVQAYLGAVKAILSPKFLEEEGLTFEQAIEGILDIWSNGVLPKRKS